MLLYSNFSNNRVFGHQFGVVPYVAFPVFNRAKANYKLKLGLGLAYFTNSFDSMDNTANQLVGAPFSWDFKLFLYRNMYSSSNFNLFLGAGLSHESNGHVKMPNMGINSILLSLTGQFYTNNNPYFVPNRVKGKNHAPKKMFIYLREGIGIHEQSVSEGPLTGRKKPVYATSIALGYTYNNHLKLRSGFTYKYYEQYHTHLTENNINGLSNQPKLNASALVFYVGNEFLMSHFSMDTEVGINLYKPFYNQFHPSNKIGPTLLKIFATRLGLHTYLFDTNKLPPHNISLGINLNANLAKADFTELSISYTYNFQ
ncbi:MAG: acyloxyacyl hydrolase [Vicingus serpentipes]|nr:acyloxyacyl hydrolase [Vicingus serpentipes]